MSGCDGVREEGGGEHGQCACVHDVVQLTIK